MKRLLLFSNSTCYGRGYLDHGEGAIREVLGASPKRVLFVPFALKDHDGYATMARTRFEKMGYALESIHTTADMRAAVESADAIFIGGGNTFRLLKALYDRQLIDLIRERVHAGIPYIGSSAGTNVATVNIRTTNDMPIVYPPTFDALGLVPFNMNAHYFDADSHSTHMGETREERLKEFLEENRNLVVGLREGAWLVVEDDRVVLQGNGAKLFYPDGAIVDLQPGAAIQVNRG